MTDQPKKNPAQPQENPEGEAEEYKVGRGRPPREHQFKPKHSGNPSGRRKREETCEDLLKEEMLRLISVRENGKPMTLSMKETFVKGVVNGAIQGNSSDEKILMIFETPPVEPRRGELKIIAVDSEDDIPRQRRRRGA